jgi:hypothetical protein
LDLDLLFDEEQVAEFTQADLSGETDETDRKDTKEKLEERTGRNWEKLCIWWATNDGNENDSDMTRRQCATLTSFYRSS